MPRSASRLQMCEAMRGPKASSGLCSGVTSDEPDVLQSARAHVLAGHQRQLVERQGPGDRGGHGEGHALHAPRVEVRQQRGEGADVARTGEGQRPRDRHVGRGAHGDEQRVVVHRVAPHGMHAAGVGVDRREPVGPQVGAVVGRDADEVEALRRAAPEGLGDRALALDEVGVGLEQLDLGARPEVAVQRDQRFETGDPAAGDDDPGHVVEARHAQRAAPSVASPAARSVRRRIKRAAPRSDRERSDTADRAGDVDADRDGIALGPHLGRARRSDAGRPGRAPGGARRSCSAATTSRTRGAGTPGRPAGPEVDRLAIGVEDALEDRLERARHDGDAERGEHGLGGGVGLLRGQAALLERERGDVAGGVDVVGARHATVVVDCDEARASCRRPGTAGRPGRGV